MRKCPECNHSLNDWQAQCPSCALILHPAVLFWSGFEVRPPYKGRQLWLINLTDEKGNQHTWAPKWEDLLSALIGAAVCEKTNARSPQWLQELADAATTVLEICAERLTPLFGAVEGGKHLLQESQRQFAKQMEELVEE